MAAPGTAFTADIAMYGFQFAPYQWTFCAGQLVGIAQNQALFSLIGTFYGGDGRVSMGMPRLTSRAPVGFNMGGGVGVTPYQIGTHYGFEYITLELTDLPSHSHSATFTPSGGSAASGTMSVLNSGASSASPTTNQWIAGGGANVFGTKGAFESEVTIEGLTVTGGGGLDGVVTIGNNGDSQDHYNMAPFQAVNFSICEFGLYPSRN